MNKKIKKKQSTRMIKVNCSICDSKWYASRTQWAKGLGKCDVRGCDGKKALDYNLVTTGKLTQEDYDSIINSTYVPDSTNIKYRN